MPHGKYPCFHAGALHYRPLHPGGDLSGNLEKQGESAQYIEGHGVFIRFESSDKEKVLETLREGSFCGTVQGIGRQPASGWSSPESGA